MGVRSPAVGALVLVALTLVGCDGSSPDGMSRDAQVYVAAIRDVLAEQPPPEQPDAVPVVFVVGVGEKKIPAKVQAAVAADLDDDADIRFADERSEAVLADEEHAPVRDDGLLIVIGQVEPDVNPVQVAVEAYRSEDDWSKRLLTTGRSSSEWTVTSEATVPPGSS
jgi:hypothetical protein